MSKIKRWANLCSFLSLACCVPPAATKDIADPSQEQDLAKSQDFSKQIRTQTSAQVPRADASAVDAGVMPSANAENRLWAEPMRGIPVSSLIRMSEAVKNGVEIHYDVRLNPPQSPNQPVTATLYVRKNHRDPIMTLLSGKTATFIFRQLKYSAGKVLFGDQIVAEYDDKGGLELRPEFRLEYKVLSKKEIDQYGDYAETVDQAYVSLVPEKRLSASNSDVHHDRVTDAPISR